MADFFWQPHARTMLRRLDEVHNHFDAELREVDAFRAKVDSAARADERQAMATYLREQIARGGWHNGHRFSVVLEQMAQAVERGVHADFVAHVQRTEKP